MRRCHVSQMLPTLHLRDTVEVVHRLVAMPSIVVRRRRRLHRPAGTNPPFQLFSQFCNSYQPKMVSWTPQDPSTPLGRARHHVGKLA